MKRIRKKLTLEGGYKDMSWHERDVLDAWVSDQGIGAAISLRIIAEGLVECDVWNLDSQGVILGTDKMVYAVTTPPPVNSKWWY